MDPSSFWQQLFFTAKRISLNFLSLYWPPPGHTFFGGNHREIILHLEYQSVCLFVPIGLAPPPSPASECCPPWNHGWRAALPCGSRGRATLACGWGGGRSQCGRLETKPGTLSTLWREPTKLNHNLLADLGISYLLKLCLPRWEDWRECPGRGAPGKCWRTWGAPCGQGWKLRQIRGKMRRTAGW